MGIIWSLFKKNVSTKEKLKKIQEEITSLEEYKEFTEQRRKKLVGNFVALSIFFYVLAAVVCYFYYLPPTVEEKILYATPFLGTIVIIYFIKRFLTCYYRWKVRRNENKLEKLKTKKSTILEQVMDTETYKVAKDILETFAPETLRKTSMTSSLDTPAHRMQMQQSGELRRRIVSPLPSQPPSAGGPRPTLSVRGPRPSAPSFSYARPPPVGTPRPPRQPMVRPNVLQSPPPSVGPPRIAYSSLSPRTSYRRPEGVIDGDAPPGPPMPRPILPRERGMLDRFVEYLVGDGPSNRYALVCRQCESHNGMALKDEFPYIAFRCAYCYYWNPARKQKPAPPRLEPLPVPRLCPTPAHDARNGKAEEEEEESSTEEEETESDSSSGSNASSEESGKELQRNALAEESHCRSNGNEEDEGMKTKVKCSPTSTETKPTSEAPFKPPEAASETNQTSSPSRPEAEKKDDTSTELAAGSSHEAL